MSIETISGLDIQYYLVAFDAAGNERTDEKHGLMSQRLLEILTAEPITDVFIFSHGWLGDVPAAKRQYDRWIKVMYEQTQDLERMRQVRPGFKALLVGLHWPSMPWGDENLEASPTSFGTAATATEVDPLEYVVNFYAAQIADTETARQALYTIFVAADENMAPDHLPLEVSQAYKTLAQEADLQPEGDGVGAAPGMDHEAFDPDAEYKLVKKNPANYGDFSLSALLAPLRTLSFWKMKDRARQFGESGGFKLLTTLQQAGASNVRFHLMGHSFGSIVVTAMLAGPDRKGKLVRPVNSVALVQGALSLWSYCSDIPVRRGMSGYFHSVIAEKKVAGPIVTTQSKHDTALSKMYPLGAGSAMQISFAPGKLPTYGALGTFGTHGDGLESISNFMNMLPITESYQFSPNKIYNLESSQFINKKDGRGGAHNDIDKPEVAHAIWQAAMV
jgi:hypothetical protein